jgi:peptidoglycan/xylan/chitin deacetylase (PgdA/CDA1 family)
MFFVKGNAVAGRESVVQQIIVRGHDIGCHGYAHLDYWRRGPLASLADVRNGYEAVDRALGITGGRYPFRPPNGRLNLVVLFYLLFIRRVKIVPWTGDIGDRRPERYRDIEGVVTVIRRRSRGIILAHDSDSRLPGLEAYTQNAVKAILGAIT